MTPSVSSILSAVSGIINLSLIDKKAAAEKMNLPQSLLQDGGLFQSLGGVAIAIFIVALVIVTLLIARCLVKNKKVLLFLLKVKDFLFWNFLIRYFQASYINFNFAAVACIYYFTTGLQDSAMSALILMFQYVLVIYICFVLITKPLSYFDRNETKKKLGNLYSFLSSRSRAKIVFGTMFYIQRSLIIIIIVVKIDYGVQFGLLQLLLMTNALYIFSSSPYHDFCDGKPDYLNTVLLLVI